MSEKNQQPLTEKAMYEVPPKDLGELAAYWQKRLTNALTDQQDVHRSAIGHDQISLELSDGDKEKARTALKRLQSVKYNLTITPEIAQTDARERIKMERRTAWGENAYVSQILAMPETGAGDILFDISQSATSEMLGNPTQHLDLITIADYTVRELETVYTALGAYVESGSNVRLKWDVVGDLIPLGEDSLNAEILSSSMVDQLTLLLEKSALNSELFIHTAEALIGLCKLINPNAAPERIISNATRNTLLRAINKCRGQETLAPVISSLYTEVVLHPTLRSVFAEEIGRMSYDRARTKPGIPQLPADERE